jgi:uncharacterized protein
MRGALAIFAKTPGASPVKTRLASSIGKALAEEFYMLAVKSVEEVATHACSLSGGTLNPYWLVAEEESVDHLMWKSFPTLWTGSGGLGDRLNYVYQTLLKTHDYVVLMGTDSPQLSPALIWEGATLCTKTAKDYVIGPCTDGGFYLFASSKQIDPTVWLETTYSQSNTLSVLKQNLLPYQSQSLERQQDVDIEADLKSLLITLSSSSLLSKQNDLLNWLKELTL